MAEDLAEQYLEELQRGCVSKERGEDLQQRYEHIAKIFPQPLIAAAQLKFGANPPELVQWVINASASRLPTTLESAARFSLIHFYRSRLEAVLDCNERALLSRVTIGSLPSGQFSGMVLRVPETSDQFLAVIESGLFNFLFHLGFILGRAMETSKDGSLEDIDFNQDSFFGNALESLLVKYATTGRPNGAFAKNKNSEHGIDNLITMAAELFVVAHEFGHVLLGHLEDPNLIRCIIGNQTVDAVAQSWEQEFQADEKAMKLLALTDRQHGGVPPVIACAGAGLCFSAAEIFWNGLTILRDGTVSPYSSKTHPPPSDRRRKIRQWADSQFDASSSSLDINIDAFFGRLFEHVRPTLHSRHEGGIPTAPVWG